MALRKLLGFKQYKQGHLIISSAVHQLISTRGRTKNGDVKEADVLAWIQK